MDNRTTPERILDIAERLVQTQGFNAFSYGDISKEIGITTASLHYHFPSKAALGTSLIRRYSEAFHGALAGIDAKHRRARRKLVAYARLYERVLRDDRMCLCGMLAADLATLPREMRARLTAFFDLNEVWLARVLAEGRDADELAFAGSAEDQARLLLGALEGAMLVARSYSEVSRFTRAASGLLAALDA